MAQTSSKGPLHAQPLKAVLPLASVTKDTSNINQKSENNSPLSPTIRWKNRAYLESGLRSPGALNQVQSKICYGDTMMLKRTLSFDTIYLNQKAQYVYGNSYTTLCIDKSTQTWDSGAVAKWKQESFSDEEKIDRFFRHRFQRKDSSNSSSVSEHSTTQTPSITRGNRNSMEGLNQEIERLVLVNRVEREDDRDITEGHRAPLAEILGLSRSVNTQTPNETMTPNSLSSGSPSRCNSPRAHRPPSEASSPGGGPSPKINRFLSREPPDGCEKVPLKFVEDNVRKPMCDLHLLDNFSPLKPSVTFTLRPSTGSAFYPLTSEKSASQTVTSEKPAFVTVTSEKPAFQTVTNEKSAFETVTNENPAFETATNERAAFQTVANEKSAFQTVTSEKLAFQTVLPKHSTKCELNADVKCEKS